MAIWFVQVCGGLIDAGHERPAGTGGAGGLARRMVLLTGRADEQIAVQAFNASPIEQYVPKQAGEISRRLAGSIQRLLDDASRGHAPGLAGQPDPGADGGHFPTPCDRTPASGAGRAAPVGGAW